MSNFTDIFKKKPLWFGCGNDYDCVLGYKLNDADKRTLRNNFNIDLNEEILFMRDTSFWNDKNQGLVMTNRGLYVLCDNDKPNEIFIIEWKNFNQVIYQELVFYFFNGDNQEGALHYDYLIKCSDESIVSKQKYICEFLNEVAALVEPDLNPLDLANEGKYEQALSVADDLISADPENAYGYFVKGRCIYLYQSNQKEIDNDIISEGIDLLYEAKRHTDDENDLSIIHSNLAYLYELMGQTYNARNSYILALENTTDRKGIFNEIENSENELKHIWDTYNDVYEYPDRKFCMIVRDADIGGCIVSGIDVFRQSNIPSVFRFPMGHPYPNQLYIGHPYNKGLYVPYDESEDIFFMDKVHELCYLLECLGAESIEITSLKGKQISEVTNSNMNLSGGVDIKMFSVNGKFSGRQSNNLSSDSKTTRSYTIRLDPMTNPYLPDNLIWYKEQPQWQRLVERRLRNNILEYSERIQSSETRFTSSSEISDIQASAKYLWTKVDANVSQNIETQFKSSSETIWEINVKFRSLKNFNDTIEKIEEDTQLGLTVQEQEYLDEVKFCLEEDGIISDKEEKMLDRLRSKLNISVERANQLRKSLLPSLTKEEQEYIDEVRACLEEDGFISPKEEKMLDRLRARLGITESRAAEIRKTYV